VLEPAHLRGAAAWSAARFGRLPATDDTAWAVSSPVWSRRRTLDHLVDTLELYAAAVRQRVWPAPPRDGDPRATPAELLTELARAADRLGDLLEELPDGERAEHPSGRADRAGWVGMACTELLVHTWDALGPGVVDAGSRHLAEAVVDRVLPWAPAHPDGWVRLLQVTGRAPAGDLGPAGSDWWWQSAPLAEWDGRPRVRTRPPQW
jgi:hypothetical protein